MRYKNARLHACCFSNINNNLFRYSFPYTKPLTRSLCCAPLPSFLIVPETGTLPDHQLKALASVLARSKEKLQRLTSEHRDLHGTVSKVGKAIDRNFVCDLSSTARNDVLVHERNVQLLNKVIAQHFYRQGMDDVADSIIQESAMSRDEIYPEPFAELHRIWESIQQRNLQPALAWALRHSDELAAKNSALEFKLHRLAFIQIVTADRASQCDAIMYARTNFAKFVQHFEKDIQILMGTLMYLPNGLENSPYRKLNAPEMWMEVSGEEGDRVRWVNVGIHTSSTSD